MSTRTAALPISAWTDAAARGTRVERALIATAATLIRVASRSARLRSERRECRAPFAETERERMRADAVRLGLLRR